MELIKIEKLSEFKKATKAFIRGAIKTKLFGDEKKNAISLVVSKDYENAVNLTIAKGVYSINLDAIVSVRVYNKIDDALFKTLTAQFNKLKNFGGVKVEVKNLVAKKK
jgi:tRNA(Leu) C34 or U34 (ribose-2'-O)-methylase TrmL